MVITAVISLAAIALAGAAIVTVVGVRWVAEPLEELLAKTRRIGQGDFGKPLAVHSQDELGQLAQALNEMCVQLNDQQETIRAEAAGRILALEQLRHADRLKTVGRLAAGIAHELGTPLNVVSGRAALIASDSLTADDIRTSAQTIKQEADRIADIIRQLLDFARQRSPQRSRVSLVDLVERTFSFLQPLADKRNVELRWAPGDNAAVAWLDSSQIQQVLTNLVVNAIQAMPDGGLVTTALGTAMASPPDRADLATSAYQTITVEDQGHGIAAEDLKQIFEPFYTTKDVGEGTGLGLSIAFGIVQEHGGWIDVVSEPGKGSKFTVFLPQEENTTCAEES
jgi:signal transduction histidine kinase